MIQKPQFSIVQNPIRRQSNPPHQEIKISSTILKKLYIKWSNAIIIKVYKGSFSFRYLHAQLMKLRSFANTFKIIPNVNGYYTINFMEHEHYLQLIKEGPWFINGFYLAMRIEEVRTRS